MPHRVAIQPDDTTARATRRRRCGCGCCARRHEAVPVEVHRAYILHQVKGCDGFMWRFAHTPADRAIARRLLPVLERSLGLAVYPDQATALALRRQDRAGLASGVGGRPVAAHLGLVRSRRGGALGPRGSFPWCSSWRAAPARRTCAASTAATMRSNWIQRALRTGLFEFAEAEEPALRREARLLKSVGDVIEGRAPSESSARRRGSLAPRLRALPGVPPRQRVHTRVTVIGRRAFADPGASTGRETSGRAAADASTPIPQDRRAAAVQLALDTARRLGTQSCAMDILSRAARSWPR